MYCSPKDTLINPHFPRMLVLVGWLFFASFVTAAVAPGSEEEADSVVIVEGEDQMIYEYRQNGVLVMIKIVPENGRPYYMVPADGGAHYESLDHKRKLYPQWVIVEW